MSTDFKGRQITMNATEGYVGYDHEALEQEELDREERAKAIQQANDTANWMKYYSTNKDRSKPSFRGNPSYD
jgi:hypothetical protein